MAIVILCVIKKGTQIFTQLIERWFLTLKIMYVPDMLCYETTFGCVWKVWFALITITPKQNFFHWQLLIGISWIGFTYSDDFQLIFYGWLAIPIGDDEIKDAIVNVENSPFDRMFQRCFNPARKQVGCKNLENSNIIVWSFWNRFSVENFIYCHRKYQEQ